MAPYYISNGWRVCGGAKSKNFLCNMALFIKKSFVSIGNDILECDELMLAHSLLGRECRSSVI